MTKEDYIVAFKNIYEYDEADDFDNTELARIIEENIEDCESCNPTEQEMADVVKDGLWFVEYGDTSDTDELERIREDYHNRFPSGR